MIKYTWFIFTAPPIERDFAISKSQKNKLQSKYELLIDRNNISTIPFHVSHATPASTNHLNHKENNIEELKNQEQDAPKYYLDNRDNDAVNTNFLSDENPPKTNNTQLSINPELEVDFDTADTYMDKEHFDYDFNDEEERQLIIARKILRDDIGYAKRAYHKISKKTKNPNIHDMNKKNLTNVNLTDDNYSDIASATATLIKSTFERPSFIKKL